jgi:hypothetical protein
MDFQNSKKKLIKNAKRDYFQNKKIGLKSFTFFILT